MIAGHGERSRNDGRFTRAGVRRRGSARAPVMSDAPLNAAEIVERLEEAGVTMLTMDRMAPSTMRVVTGMKWLMDIARLESLSGGIPVVETNPVAISRMNEAYGWLSRIPDHELIVRRVLGTRSLINPVTGRFVYSWHRLGLALSADPKLVQRWHAHGVDQVVQSLAAEQRSAATIKANAQIGRVR